MNEARTSAILRKNYAKELYVRATLREGYTLADLRVLSQNGCLEGEPLANRDDVCLALTKLPELIKSIQAAERGGVW